MGLLNCSWLDANLAQSVLESEVTGEKWSIGRAGICCSVGFPGLKSESNSPVAPFRCSEAYGGRQRWGGVSTASQQWRQVLPCSFQEPWASAEHSSSSPRRGPRSDSQRYSLNAPALRSRHAALTPWGASQIPRFLSLDLITNPFPLLRNEIALSLFEISRHKYCAYK